MWFFDTWGPTGTLHGSSGCKDFSHLWLNTVTHTVPLTCEVELWEIIKCQSDVSQHYGGAAVAVILKYVSVFPSWPWSLGSKAHHARFCGGACVPGWVIWSIQFCLCHALQHNSPVVADLSEWANATRRGVTEHLENTNSQSGWLWGRINVSLGFSVPLICAFKCMFAVDTCYWHCGEAANVSSC